MNPFLHLHNTFSLPWSDVISKVLECFPAAASLITDELLSFISLCFPIHKMRIVVKNYKCDVFEVSHGRLSREVKLDSSNNNPVLFS